MTQSLVGEGGVRVDSLPNGESNFIGVLLYALCAMRFSEQIKRRFYHESHRENQSGTRSLRGEGDAYTETGPG
jgi:hypothetical protein